MVHLELFVIWVKLLRQAPKPHGFQQSPLAISEHGVGLRINRLAAEPTRLEILAECAHQGDALNNRPLPSGELIRSTAIRLDRLNQSSRSAVGRSPPVEVVQAQQPDAVTPVSYPDLVC